MIVLVGGGEEKADAGYTDFWEAIESGVYEDLSEGGGQKVGCRFWGGHRKVEYAKDLIGDR